MNLKEEKKLWKKGYRFIVGLDEAGRGALAGPVTAAAITVWQILSPKAKIPKELKEVNDSKKLSPKKREELYQIITNYPQIEWGIGRAGPRVIDRINILEATKLAMKRSIKSLERKTSRKSKHLILDGNSKIDLPVSQQSIVKADEKIFSCAIASIIAKVTRDRAMQRYHQKYSQYGFDRHKGYPTKHHKKMLKKHGICKIHRKSFKPVKRLLNC